MFLSAFLSFLIVDGVFQDLDVKSLLLEAYVKGQQELLYVVPFVAKVLESSVRSVVSDCMLGLIAQVAIQALQKLSSASH